jgi:peptide/nickel transport system permease protein
MLRFVVRRLLLLAPILIGLSIIVFAWVHALPGSPIQSLLGERATPKLVAEYNQKYGLNRPIPVQYWDQLQAWAHLDFGQSISDHRSVLTEIGERFPATVELAIAAMIVAVGLGIPLGVIAAKNHGTIFDHGSLVASLLGIATPVFFLGLVLN